MHARGRDRSPEERHALHLNSGGDEAPFGSGVLHLTPPALAVSVPLLLLTHPLPSGAGERRRMMGGVVMIRAEAADSSHPPPPSFCGWEAVSVVPPSQCGFHKLYEREGMTHQVLPNCTSTLRCPHSPPVWRRKSKRQTQWAWRQALERIIE